MEDDASKSGGSSAFPNTQWTVIIEAGSSHPERAREALERLCRAYRQPIVNWFRRHDFRQDPEDLAQTFLVYLLEKSLLTKVAPRTARFRCFLAACMRRFLHDNWDKRNAQKAGGGVQPVPLADHDAEAGADTDPDSPLDIDFALAIHAQVMSQLAPRDELKPYLFLKDTTEGWNGIAAALGTTPTAIRQEVCRLRRRHWMKFRDEVAEIVKPSDRAEETKYLYELLFRNLPADEGEN